jgi:hypothetical protein
MISREGEWNRTTVGIADRAVSRLPSAPHSGISNTSKR